VIVCLIVLAFIAIAPIVVLVWLLTQWKLI
jgi:hypothetical protein